MRSKQRAIVASLAVAMFVAAFAAYWASAGRAIAPDPHDPGLIALGEQVYREGCASCHGAELEGQPDWRRPLSDGRLPAPPHNADGHTWHHPDRLLFEITKFGGQALAPPGFKSSMPAFGEQLSDREIWAVLAFIKTRWPQEIRERQAEITRIDP